MATAAKSRGKRYGLQCNAMHFHSGQCRRMHVAIPGLGPSIDIPMDAERVLWLLCFQRSKLRCRAVATVSQHATLAWLGTANLGSNLVLEAWHLVKRLRDECKLQASTCTELCFARAWTKRGPEGECSRSDTLCLSTLGLAMCWNLV